MTTKSRNLSIYARGLSRFEAMMWVFTRLTALAMYALILSPSSVRSSWVPALT
jgi:hypothetical protein